MTILVDIGGTYARFALQSAPHAVEKFTAGDFKSFEDALAAFCNKAGIHDKPPLLIATAAYPDGALWRFVNRNSWVIDPAALKKQGWDVEPILNDFEAATWGLLGLESGDQEILQKGVTNNDLPQCLAGPGTGLGLGYLIPAGGSYHVQRTYGGHMLAAGLTDEHTRIIAGVQALKTDGTIPVFENFVSGLGLVNIYQAVGGKKFKTPEEMFENIGDPQVSDSMRLFHEFFGLFAQTAVVTGHAYGGLYLTGGVLDKLAAAKRFDFDLFRKFFVLPGVSSVRRALEETPVIRVTYPYLTLKGLVKAHG